jgi:glycosyltransferase involved in cell wall biosynthesis
MRIIVIKNSKHRNSYTSCIHNLLEEIGRRQDYKTMFIDNLQNNLGESNSITFITLQTPSFLNKFLQQQKLKSFIKKNKVDLLIQNAEHFIKQKRIPQLLIAGDLKQLPAVKEISLSKIFLLTYSQHAKQTIIDNGFTNNIHIIPFFAETVFQPINWSMKQQVKIDYTEGTEYFIMLQPFTIIDNILQLLKAFSGFKRWQQSSMKLILAGKLYVPQSDWEEKLSTYKYRHDVLVYNKITVEEKIKLLAGAYACIHLSEKDDDILPLLQSIQCYTPVIPTETQSAKEYIINTGLITKYSHEEITKQLILMYKDENLRSKLIENCNIQAEEFSKERALQRLQDLIL